MKNIWNDPARFLMGTIFLVGERSEPLSRVFNDQLSGIYMFRAFYGFTQSIDCVAQSRNS